MPVLLLMRGGSLGPKNLFHYLNYVPSAALSNLPGRHLSQRKVSWDACDTVLPNLDLDAEINSWRAV